VAEPEPIAAAPSSRVRDCLEVRRNLGISSFEGVNNFSNIVYIAADWAMIILVSVGAEVVWHTLNPVAAAVVYVIAVVVIGSRMRGLMNLTHQASHHKLFANRRMNDWVARLFTAWPLLISLSDYQASHLNHHGALGDLGRDPKAQRYAKLGLIVAPSRARAFLVSHIVLPLLFRHIGYSINNVVRASGERIGRATFGITVIIFALELDWGSALGKYWVVPFLTSFQMIRHWAEVAEHASLIEDPDEWMRTRSWTSNRITAWLLAPHWDSYHLLHHQFPGVPHFRYPTVHRVLMRECAEYRAGHHCDGFLLRRRPDAPSVLEDILRPDRLSRYRQPLAAIKRLEPRMPSAG
jgi:fatty acid desaturase